MPKLNNGQAWAKVLAESLTVRANAEYHAKKRDRYDLYANGITVAIGLAGCSPLVGVVADVSAAVWPWVAAGVAAMSVVSSGLKWAKRAQQHSDLLSEYSQIRAGLDGLKHRLENTDSGVAIGEAEFEELLKLQAQRQLLGPREPSLDEAAFRQIQDKVRSSVGDDVLKRMRAFLNTALPALPPPGAPGLESERLSLTSGVPELAQPGDVRVSGSVSSSVPGSASSSVVPLPAPAAAPADHDEVDPW